MLTTSIRNILLPFVAFFGASMADLEVALSRVEYAVRHGFVSCTQCHVSPVGGGIRNSNGKLFGFHTLPGPRLSQTGLFQLDSRTAFVHTVSKAGTSRRGIAVMSTNGAVAVPVTSEAESEDGWGASFVASYGFGQLESGIRDSFFLAQNQASTTPFFESILVGKMRPPFGYLTDEHRTYTRLQSRTTFVASDFETGVMLSGTPTFSFHYDLMLTNGERGAGGATPSPTSPWGVYGNFRLMPFRGPLILSASYNQQGNETLPYEATAVSGMAALSMDRLTAALLPGSFIFEISRARGWNNQTLNPALARTLGASAQPAWYSSIANAWSEALLAQASIEFSPRFTTILRAEQFTPDVDFGGETFLRYSAGVRYFFLSNVNLQVMYEEGYSTRSGMNAASGVPAVDSFLFGVLHVWL